MNINFVKPIIIVGAPRSGTSLIQKLIRDHPAFVSLAKESDIIWNRYCHPRLREWESDACSGEQASEPIIQAIRREFAAYALPATVWQQFNQFNIMRYQRHPLLSYFVRHGYKILALIRQCVQRQNKSLRLVEKSVTNSLRLNFIDKIFPDAKYIYIKRDGRATINSLINGWYDPNRFFSYQLPVKLAIPNYHYDRWNFILPRGWRDYVNRPLEEVVAFQWVSIHQAIQQAFNQSVYQNRVLAIKLEDLSVYPQDILKQVSHFIEVPWSSYFEKLTQQLPIVNSPHDTVNLDRWRLEHKDMVERVEPLIGSMMKQLGYGDSY